MTKLCPHAVESLKETTLADHPSANSCADGQINKIFMTHPGAELPLCESRHVGIVIQVSRNIEMLG